MFIIKTRLREGYKNNLKKRVKEKRFKKKIRKEYYEAQKGYCFGVCTFRGYYIDEKGLIKTTNKYSKRYQFKTPKYYRHIRRRYFNESAGDINITSLGRNYEKITSKSS